MTPRWSAEQIPDQAGRTFVVTGATSGLGLATTAAVAQRGAHVILAVRDERKGRAVIDGLSRAHPEARLEVRRLDLADLDSVRAFADGVRADHRRLDVLVNNAGVMAPPRTRTLQGHELQFAVNHLGHFALSGLLFDLLQAGRDARVVTVSSMNHRQATLRFDDLTGERGYARMAFYNQSKLANAVFGVELHRRLTAAGSPVHSVLAHPGFAATDMPLRASGPARVLFGRIARPLAQAPASGALPQLYAATAPDVAGGVMIGPAGVGELRGAPTQVRLSATATDPDVGRRLWDLSEEATGVRFTLPVPVM